MAEVVTLQSPFNETVKFFIQPGDTITVAPEGGIIYTEAGFSSSNSPVGNIFFGVVNSEAALNLYQPWYNSDFIRQAGRTWYTPGQSTAIALRPSANPLDSVVVIRIQSKWDSNYLAYRLVYQQNNNKRRYAIQEMLPEADWSHFFPRPSQAVQATRPKQSVLTAPPLPASLQTPQGPRATQVPQGRLPFVPLETEFPVNHQIITNGYNIRVNYPTGDSLVVLPNGHLRFTKAGMTPSTNPQGNLFLTGWSGLDLGNVFGLNLFEKVPHPSDTLVIDLNIAHKPPYSVVATATDASGNPKIYQYDVEAKLNGTKARFHLTKKLSHQSELSLPVYEKIPVIGRNQPPAAPAVQPAPIPPLLPPQGKSADTYGRLDLSQPQPAPAPSYQGGYFGKVNPDPTVYVVPPVQTAAPKYQIEGLYRPETAPVANYPSLLALDFDLTIMAQHIYAHYCRLDENRQQFMRLDRSQLQALVSPASSRYLNDLVAKVNNMGIPVVIVSYGNADCIFRVVQEFFPGLADRTKIYTPARVGQPDGTNLPDNKVGLIGLAAQEYKIDTARVMLVDDTAVNVTSVQQYYHTPYGLIVNPTTALTDDNFAEIYRTFGLKM